MAGNWSKGSGSSTMLILKLLTEKDMYGYEMIETLGVRSNHVSGLRVGTQVLPYYRKGKEASCQDHQRVADIRRGGL